MNTSGSARAKGIFGRADVNGIPIGYRIAGSGEPVVLLHGFPEASEAWQRVLPSLLKRQVGS